MGGIVPIAYRCSRCNNSCFHGPLLRLRNLHMTLPAYSALTSVFTRLYRYQHLGAFMGWDQAAMMPPGGNEARGAALAELQLLMHQTLTDPALPALMTQAGNEALDDHQRASLHEMRRQWEPANLLPARLVEAQSLAGSRCEHAWRTQRKANDWPGFLANFREVVTLAREEAQTLSQAQGVSPYDALMGKYEPGTRSADIDAIFGQVKTWLPGLIAQVRDHQANDRVIQPQGPFSTESQRALRPVCLGGLGRELSAGRL